jgi:hypothetical protein
MKTKFEVVIRQCLSQEKKIRHRKKKNTIKKRKGLEAKTRGSKKAQTEGNAVQLSSKMVIYA